MIWRLSKLRLLRGLVPSLLLLSMALVMAPTFSSCSPDEESQSDTEADEEDEEDIVIPVPMGLVDLAQIDQYTDALIVQNGTGGYAGLEASGKAKRDGTKTAFEVAEEATTFSEPILTAPALASGELTRLLQFVNQALNRYFGDEKILGAEVNVRNKTSRIFRVSSEADSLAGGIPEFVVVSADNSKEFNFLLELFYRQADGQLARRFFIEYRNHPETPEKAQAHFYYLVTADEQNPTDQIVELDFDGERGTLSASFAPQVLKSEIPQKTLMKMSILEGDRYVVEGAYSWNRAGLPVTPGFVFPRYAALQTGDVELFRFAAGPAVAVQELGFIPAASVADFGFQTTPSIFVDLDYFEKYLIPYLVDVVTNPTINKDCATAGSELRTLHNPPSLPPEADNLCAGTGTIDSGTLGTVVKEICADPEARLEVTLVAGGLKNLCSEFRDGKDLVNRQAFAVEGQARRLIRNSSQLTDEHQTLDGILSSRNFFDYSAVLDREFPEIVTQPATDFSAAEPVP